MKHTTKHDQRPAIQFYINDWIVDMRGYSLRARGLWIEMICMMWKNKKRGFLQQNNNSKHDGKSLAKVLGLSEGEIKEALKELEEGEVFSYTDDKTIYCRRMFREWNLGEIRSEAGKKGADKRWQNDSKKNSKSLANGEEEVEEAKEVEKEIIDDLNNILKTSYKLTSKKNINLIRARLNEGFTVEDFKKVHRNMLKRWGTDNKMREFLRPITLYSNKFESYLNIKQDLPFSTQTAKNIRTGKEWLVEEEAKDNAKK